MGPCPWFRSPEASGSPLRPKPRTRSWLIALLCYIISSRIFRLGSSSIHFFYLSHLFINIFSFINAKNHISTLNQGFQISEKSLEALVQFISSPRTFSFFHHSSPLSKYKNTKKISSYFNLLTFLPVDLTSTCHCSHLKIIFEEFSINLFDT